MSEMHEVRLSPEEALEVGHFTVTNTITATLAVTLIMFVLAYLVRRKAGVIPSRIQVVFESIFLFFLNQLTVGLGSETKARKLAPFLMTLFVFILISNQFILIPLVNNVVTGEGHLFFRTPTTDYSLTIALALIVVISSHLIAFSISPLKHIGNYIKLAPLFKLKSIKDLPLALVDIFLGFLEIISEIAKIVSLATRLFGNIFSGEIVIAIIIGLMFATQFFIPIPFILLAAFAGVIQAFVFVLLSLLAISSNVRHVTSHH